MQTTKIEYLTHTWNPLAMRCSQVSAGCDNCWHLRMANRMVDNFILKPEYRASYAGGEPWLNKNEMSAPMSHKKPAVIGVQFMGDLFHDSITDEQIAAVFGVMAACPQHTFLILTKRPDRAEKWLEWLNTEESKWPGHEKAPCDWRVHALAQFAFDATEYDGDIGPLPEQWPLPNVWLGVSVEDQKTADDRIPALLQIPAAKRFVSVEPMLRPVDLEGIKWKPYCHKVDVIRGGFWHPGGFTNHSDLQDGGLVDLVICGAETGPGKRHMNINWALDLMDQCERADVPFFFKKDNAGNGTLNGIEYHQWPKEEQSHEAGKMSMLRRMV